MSDQRPEIQRYSPSEGADFWRSDNGKIVLHSDHLRAVTLAKIAVLEEEDAHMVSFLCEGYADENRVWRQAKLAALRKELEG